MASRSHWLTLTIMFRTNRPAAEPVSRDSATETRETPFRWNSSSRSARSRTDRVRRSDFATITVSTSPLRTSSRMHSIPGRSRFLALSPASTMTSVSSASWSVAMARIRLCWAARLMPFSACPGVLTRTYPIALIYENKKRTGGAVSNRYASVKRPNRFPDVSCRCWAAIRQYECFPSSWHDGDLRALISQNAVSRPRPPHALRWLPGSRPTGWIGNLA